MYKTVPGQAFKNNRVHQVLYFLANLSGDGDLIMSFKTQRTLAFVGVVKGNRHSGLGDATLSIFVNQVLEVGGSHLSSENETNRSKFQVSDTNDLQNE